MRSEYSERTVAAATEEGFRFVLFGRDAPYRYLQGEGSGDAAFLAALAVCSEVDVYGVGLFGRRLRDGATEIVYQHGYDAHLGRCQPQATNKSCGAPISYATNFASGHLMREVRWALWHALGVANWIWG